MTVGDGVPKEDLGNQRKTLNHEIHENNERKQWDKVVGWVEQGDCVVLTMNTSSPRSITTQSRSATHRLGMNHRYEIHESAVRFSSA